MGGPGVHQPGVHNQASAAGVESPSASGFIEPAPGGPVEGGFRAGARVGPYRIARLIDSGAMGDVYEAQHAAGSGTVALKIVRAGVVTRELRRRFGFEIEAMARLRHPNIARLIDSGVHEGEDGPRPFLVMEFIRGASLTDHAEQQRMNIAQRLGLFLKVCDAVEHAHRAGIIHRDLKPANILVDDQTAEPKVLDFGVARAVDPQGTLSSEPARGLIGSLPYMSPEQAAGRPVDTRADVYALGAILYELLTGQPPHRMGGRALADLIRAVREDEPRRLGSIVPALRGDLELIVSAATARDPARRFQSAGALAEDLRRWLRQQPLLIRPPGTLYLLRTLARRHRVALAIAAIVGVVTIAAGVLVGVHRVRAAQAEARSALMVDFVVSSSREFLLELNRRLRDQEQPLEARRAVLEATARHLDGLRRRAGDDPRVLEAVARACVELGLVIGGTGRASLGQTDQARELFETARGIYESLLDGPGGDEARLGLAEALEYLGLADPTPARVELIRRAAELTEQAAARAGPGPVAKSAQRRRLLWAAVVSSPEELAAIAERCAADCRLTPDDPEAWHVLGMARRHLCESLVETDRGGALRAALECEAALTRSIELGQDDFSNNRQLAFNTLFIASLRVGERAEEELLAACLAAVERSRALLVERPGDNFARLSHAQVVYSFTRRGAELVREAGPQTPRGLFLAGEVAAAVDRELAELDRAVPAGLPQPKEAAVRDAIEQNLADLGLPAGDRWRQAGDAAADR